MQPDKHYEVFDENAELALKELGDLISAALPEGYGFSLLIAGIGDAGNMFYLSDMERSGMIASMKEFIAKEEAKND